MAQKITAEMVKALREKTGIGMGKCKEFLEQAGGDLDKAIEILRKDGVAFAAKKVGREAKAGLIFSMENAQAVAIVEINAETDFVVQNDRFKQFSQDIVENLLQKRPKSLEEFLLQPYSKDPSLTIDQYRAVVMQSFGENIQIRRYDILAKSVNSSIGIYNHMLGKIVAVVEIDGASRLEDFTRSIAMHVVATAPSYLDVENVPPEVIAREEEVARGQAIGKSQEMVDKIMEKTFQDFYDNVCLLRQKFIKDSSLTIKELVEEQAKTINKSLKIVRFICWHVGEKSLDG
jgi:elongation factor Ts